MELLEGQSQVHLQDDGILTVCLVGRAGLQADGFEFCFYNFGLGFFAFAINLSCSLHKMVLCAIFLYDFPL